MMLVNKIKTADIELEVNESEFIVTGGKGTGAVNCIGDAKCIFNFDSINDLNWVELPEGYSKKLSLASKVTSTDFNRFLLTCVHVTNKMIESTDNLKIIQSGVEIPDVEFDFLIQGSTLSKILFYHVVSMAFTDKWVFFKTSDNVIFATRIYNDKYPELGQFLDFEGKKVVFPDDIMGIIDTAVVFSNTVEGSLVSVEVKNNKMVVSSENNEGWYQETADIESEVNSFGFTIPPELFKDILSRGDNCFIDDGKLKVKTDDYEFVSVLMEKE